MNTASEHVGIKNMLMRLLGMGPVNEDVDDTNARHNVALRVSSYENRLKRLEAIVEASKDNRKLRNGNK